MSRPGTHEALAGYILNDPEAASCEFTSQLLDELATLRQERALRESEERFSNMADMAPVMIWVAGPDNMGTFFNRAWLDFTGRSLEQELGADICHRDVTDLIDR